MLNLQLNKFQVSWLGSIEHSGGKRKYWYLIIDRETIAQNIPVINKTQAPYININL